MGERWIDFGKSSTADTCSCAHNCLFGGALDGAQFCHHRGERFSSWTVEGSHGVAFGPRF